MGRPRSKGYGAFLKWFAEHRKDADTPSHRELAYKFGVSEHTIAKWIVNNGGFAIKQSKRVIAAKVEVARKYLKLRRACLTEVMRHVGYAVNTWDSHNRKNFYNELVKAGLADRIVDAVDRDSDKALLYWVRAYKRKHGVPPTQATVAEHLGRSKTYAAKRMNALAAVYPSIGYDKELLEDVNTKKTECKGKRQRLYEWKKWQEENAPKSFGFEFKGEVWDRYLKMWDLRKKGLCWRMKLERPNAICIFEEGRVARLNSRGEVDDY